MDKFLEIHSLPKFTPEEIDTVNKLVSIKEIESTINNLPEEKVPGLDDEFY